MVNWACLWPIKFTAGWMWSIHCQSWEWGYIIGNFLFWQDWVHLLFPCFDHEAGVEFSLEHFGKVSGYLNVHRSSGTGYLGDHYWQYRPWWVASSEVMRGFARIVFALVKCSENWKRCSYFIWSFYEYLIIFIP